MAKKQQSVNQVKCPEDRSSEKERQQLSLGMMSNLNNLRLRWEGRTGHLGLRPRNTKLWTRRERANLYKTSSKSRSRILWTVGPTIILAMTLCNERQPNEMHGRIMGNKEFYQWRIHNRALRRHHCVGGGVPVNFGRRLRRAAGPKKLAARRGMDGVL